MARVVRGWGEGVVARLGWMSWMYLEAAALMIGEDKPMLWMAKAVLTLRVGVVVEVMVIVVGAGQTLKEVTGVERSARVSSARVVHIFAMFLVL